MGMSFAFSSIELKSIYPRLNVLEVPSNEFIWFTKFSASTGNVPFATSVNFCQVLGQILPISGSIVVQTWQGSVSTECSMHPWHLMFCSLSEESKFGQLSWWERLQDGDTHFFACIWGQCLHLRNFDSAIQFPCI